MLTKTDLPLTTPYIPPLVSKSLPGGILLVTYQTYR